MPTALRIGRIVAFYVALVGLWQILAMSGLWASYIFPSPVDVYREFVSIASDGELPRALRTTMQRMAIGYSLSIVVGVLLGLAMGARRVVNDTLGSLVLGVQSVPSITWLPLALLWFGLSERAIIFVVLMGSVCSVAISTRAGVRAIPPLLTRAAQMFGASRIQMYRLVVLPGILPAMVQGLRLGWSFAWRSLLAAELLYVSASLGHLLGVGRDFNNVSLIVAVMLVIVVIGVVMDRLVFGQIEGWVHRRWGLAS